MRDKVKRILKRHIKPRSAATLIQYVLSEVGMSMIFSTEKPKLVELSVLCHKVKYIKIQFLVIFVSVQLIEKLISD